MKVNIKKAAKLVGISRSTLYNHIEQKGITIEPDLSGKPMIDISELIRVYGDKIKLSDMSEEDDLDTIQHEKNTNLNKDSYAEYKYQVESLKDKLSTLEAERERERHQTTETIEMLRKQVERADSERQKLTAVLTDQRSDSEKYATKEAEYNKKLADLELTIKSLADTQTKMMEESNKKIGFFRKLFG